MACSLLIGLNCPSLLPPTPHQLLSALTPGSAAEITALKQLKALEKDLFLGYSQGTWERITAEKLVLPNLTLFCLS